MELLRKGFPGSNFLAFLFWVGIRFFGSIFLVKFPWLKNCFVSHWRSFLAFLWFAPTP